MAENTIQRVIKVDTSAGEKTVRELTAEVEQLRKQLAELQAGTSEYAKTEQKAAKARQELNAAFEIAKPDAKDLLATVQQLAEAEARDAEEVNKLVGALQAYRDAGYDVSGSLAAVSTATEQATTTTIQLDEGVNRLRESGGELIDMLVRDQQELAAVTEQRKALNKEIAQGLITEEQAREIKGELLAQETVYKNRISESRRELNATNKTVQAAEGSYDQMSQSLGRLRDQYRQLSAADRNSTIGDQMLKKIQGLDTELKNIDASIGNYQRNVGNYSSALGGLGTTFTKVAGMATVAIGVASAAIKGIGSVMANTKSTADAWNASVSAATTGWETFKQAIATGDLSNLTMRLSAAATAARELALTQAELGDQQRSLNIQRAAASAELQQLNVILRDTSESEENRRAAGERIIEIERTFAEQQTAIYQEEYDKQADLLFARVNKVKYANDEERKAAQDAFTDQVKQYVNLDENLKNEAKAYLENQKALRIYYAELANMGAGAGKYAENNKERVEKLNDAIAAASPEAKQMADFLTQLGSISDANLDQLAAAAINLGNSMGAADQATRRVQTTLGSLDKQNADAAKKAAKERADAAKKAAEETERVMRETLKIQQGLRAETEENEIKTAKENYEQDLANFNKTVKEKCISEDVAAAYRKALAEQNERDIFDIRKKYRDQEDAEEQKQIERQNNMAKTNLDREMSDADRTAARETAEAKRDITDPQALEQELQNIQQRLYEAKIALIDEMLSDTTLDADTIIELSNQRADLEIKNIKRVAEEERRAAEEKKKRDKLTQETALNIASSTLDSLSSIIGEETAAGKAAAVAAATIDTYKAANSAYASLASVPFVGPALGAAAAAAAIVAGIANVKKILATKEDGSNASSIASTPTTTTAAVVTPPAVIEQVPLTRTLTSASEEERLNQMASPQRVYVVYDDIAQAGRNVQVQQAESTF